jgi:hypothetical protein
VKVGLVVGLAVVVGVGGLVGYNTYKKRRDAAAYQALLRSQTTARRAVADKHRPVATPLLATIDKITAEATAAPPIATATPLTATPTIALAVVDNGRGNTVMIGVAQPADVARPLVARFAARAQRYLGPMGDTDSTASESAESLEGAFAELEQLKYALLVRVHHVTKPSAGPGDRFVGGAADGDAALYDLATGTRLGAFPFAVRQRDTSSVSKGGDVDGQLLDNFTFDIAAGLRGELAAFVAGTAGPAAPGAATAAELAQFGDKLLSELRLTWVLVDGVEVAAGAEGKPIVTLVSTRPEGLQFRGQVLPELAAAVTKVLGVEAEIRVRQRVASPPP